MDQDDRIFSNPLLCSLIFDFLFTSLGRIDMELLYLFNESINLDLRSSGSLTFLSGETSPHERLCVSMRHPSNNVVGIGVNGLPFGNDSELCLATSLYRSVDVSRLSLIRDLSERGVMCPLWDASDTPCLIRGSITESVYLYDETKKDF
jgi:hypothetical protein